jgi:hypothetical protein
VSGDGQLKVTATEAAAKRIDSRAGVFAGLRELIRVLKLLAKRDWNARHDDTPKLKSCMLESVALYACDKVKSVKWNFFTTAQVFENL